MPKTRIKPFRLVKYFTYSSLLVILVGTLTLSLVYTQLARKMQLKKSEDYAHLLIENLNHQIFLQFIIPVAIKYGKIKLSEPEQYKRMDKIVRGTLHSFKIEMVNIYAMNAIISYSFDSKIIGTAKGGWSYQQALAGRTTTALTRSGNVLELLLGFPKQRKISTFAPLRAEKEMAKISGPVLGVVEIIQDLSEDEYTIFRFQILAITASFVIMGLIFLILIWVVRRGEKIIQTRNLERIRLKEELELAKRLSSLGEMAAGISHEIRNPLGIIRSSAELLQKKMNKIDTDNTIPEIIVEESNRLNNIINDFLTYTKPVKLKLKSCRIEEILERCFKMLQPQLDQQGYTIQKQFSALVPKLAVDADMLHQALLNILLNAMQAMPQGGVIEAEIKCNIHSINIMIRDQGCGLGPDIDEKIWEPFFTTKDIGTGLGLGLVRNIIDSHQGVIELKNRKQQKGVQVLIKLPL